MRRTRGFTLIEMLAVVAIFALLAAFVAPNLSVLGRRALRGDARQLASYLELARQRSVMTSVPHRLYLDLDQGGYRIEWLKGDEAKRQVEPPRLDLRGSGPLPLAAPREENRRYRPMPGFYGRFQWLDEDVFFAGIEAEEGWVSRGDAFVDFARDGTASYTVIVLEGSDGQALELQILPLAEIVRVNDVES